MDYARTKSWVILRGFKDRTEGIYVKQGQELTNICVPELPKSFPEFHYKELPRLFPTYFTILATFASLKKNRLQTDGPTDRWTDRRMDTPSYGVACTRLKNALPTDRPTKGHKGVPYRDARTHLNKYPRVQQMRPRAHFRLLNTFKHFFQLYKHFFQLSFN